MRFVTEKNKEAAVRQAVTNLFEDTGVQKNSPSEILSAYNFGDGGRSKPNTIKELKALGYDEGNINKALKFIEGNGVGYNSRRYKTENRLLVEHCIKLLGEAKIKESFDKKILHETNNLPAIAQAAGLAVNPKITSVVRQDTIYSTIQAMGLPVKINAMRNVVAEVADMPTAGAVLQTIYQQFGVKGSFMVTREGKGKLYFDPKTPVDKAVALAYAKQAKLPPPNFTRLLNSVASLKEGFGVYWFWLNRNEMKPKEWNELVVEMDKLKKSDSDSNYFIKSVPGRDAEVFEIVADLEKWKTMLKRLGYTGLKFNKGWYKGITGAY